MEPVSSQDEQALLAELGRAREKVELLAGDLRSVDTELEGLSKERHAYRLLGEACGALNALSEQGAGGLFWGDTAHERGDEQVREALHRVGVFEGRVREAEDRRQAISEQICHERENAELIEDDVFDIRQQEERRKLEWVIERDVGDLPARPAIMPWLHGGEEDERFRKSLLASLFAALLLGVILPMIDLPLPERGEPLDVPERLARLIQERRQLPPSPPVQEPTQPDPVEPEAVEETVAVSEEVAPKTPQPPKPSAQSSGILAFREKFSGLAETHSAARLGSQASIRSSGDAASGRTERSMVTTQAPGSSGGINLAALSRDVGGGGGDSIEGVQVTRATSSIGSGTGSDRPLSGGPRLGRTDEEIQIVFDRHKAALYRLYNRELRRDPTLRGQMVLRLRIEPDGGVSLCDLQSSDMDAPQLSARVVDRVRTFDFGAKEGISTITILYPIDFLPAT
jgi:hypothetical protein